jgi:DNA-directed RNA polymerase specialized sigma24 family protein
MMDDLDFYGETYADIDRRLHTFAVVACRTYRLDESYVEDIQQELWLKVIKLKKTYNPEHRSISMWMKEIANRLARIEKDKHVNPNAMTLDESFLFPHYDDIAEQIDIKDFLKSLDPILVMNGMDLKDEEIALILDRPVNQITAARREAFKELTK